MLDVNIIGAGFAGLYMLHAVRRAGFSASLIEAAEDIGGTWNYNRYPGARCDNESADYSYSFDPALDREWRWTERYASQPEILRYLHHVADRFGLWDNIVLNSRVVSLSFDEEAVTWHLTTESGLQMVSRYCVLATGCLSRPNLPFLPNTAVFRGRTFHTGLWPKIPPIFKGHRVGVVGTGSSAIQLIPQVAREAFHLTVFQRSANFVVPAGNHSIPEKQQQESDRSRAERRYLARTKSRTGWLHEPPRGRTCRSSIREINEEYEKRWEMGGVNYLNSFDDILTDVVANESAAKFVRGKIHSIVTDPTNAHILSPHDHPIGTKRLCCADDYYETFNRNNVTLIDVSRAPIKAFTAEGLKDCEGKHYPLDDVIFATGFDAFTGSISAINIRGRSGHCLRDDWKDGPISYLGLMCTGYPNLFTVTGPGSPSVLSNMIVSIEQHVEWITECLTFLRAHNYVSIEPTPEAQEYWMQEVDQAANKTLFNKAKSWYTGENIPGKPRRFLPYAGGVNVYRACCVDIAKDNYRGFTMAHSGPKASKRLNRIGPQSWSERARVQEPNE